MESMKDKVRRLFEDAKKEYESIGGFDALKSGAWLYQIIQRSFKSYFDNANVDFFERKYGTSDKKKIATKLVSVAARNASILGAITGAAVSADEIASLMSIGTTLPANIAIAATAIGGEAILLLRFQLQLIANLAKLKGVPLDPEDPEDILVILAFALGGSAAEAAGKVGMKVGGKLAGRATKQVFKKELLATLKRLASKVGVKILQKSIVKYTVPIVSTAIGGVWNFASTKAVSKIALSHFESRIVELSDAPSSAAKSSDFDVG